MITVIVSVVNIILIFFFSEWFNFIGILLLVIPVIVINFLIVRFFIERYVFRKVKLIYKLIYEAKKDKYADDITKESLEDVNTKVMEWAENTKKELATLKSLEEYRKNYVGNISHELKTPIFSIQAYLYTLLEGGLYDENINKDYLRRAVDNTVRLQNIVEDLEVITKLESGQMEMELRKFDIRQLTNDIFKDLKSMAKKKK
ncbi:MAG: hypothetical protein RIR48_1915, partial [Bacteroidota bacterium]